jgi:hypothetical protein
MTTPLVDGIIIVLVAAVLMAWAERRFLRRMERDIRAFEARYDAQFDLAGSRQKLDEYFDLLCATLPQASLTAPPVSGVSLTPDSPLGRVKQAVSFAEARFGLALPPYEVELTVHIPPHHAGEAASEGKYTLDLAGTEARVRPIAGVRKNWRVRIQEGAEVDVESLFIIAAHEIAHVALLSRDIELTPSSENECLTDAAAVLAGFGELMERTKLVITRRWAGKVNAEWTYQFGGGYLHRGAIRYLNQRRAELLPHGEGGGTSARPASPA